MKNIKNVSDLPLKGMLLTVYSSGQYGAGAFTNGPSARHTQIIVVGDGVPEIFSAESSSRDTLPTFVLREHVSGYPTLVPADTLEGGEHDGAWVADGGNFAETSDSRWSELVRKITGGNGAAVVPIHDRAEIGQESGGGLVRLTGSPRLLSHFGQDQA
jgi:hypothetical protein